MDKELIFLNLKFTMADDMYSNIHIDKMFKNRGVYILKAEDIKKPQSVFSCIITDRIFNTIYELGQCSITIFEHNLYAGETIIDKEYILHRNGDITPILTGRNVEY